MAPSSSALSPGSAESDMPAVQRMNLALVDLQDQGKFDARAFLRKPGRQGSEDADKAASSVFTAKLKILVCLEQLPGQDTHTILDTVQNRVVKHQYTVGRSGEGWMHGVKNLASFQSRSRDCC